MFVRTTHLHSVTIVLVRVLKGGSLCDRPPINAQAVESYYDWTWFLSLFILKSGMGLVIFLLTPGNHGSFKSEFNSLGFFSGESVFQTYPEPQTHVPVTWISQAIIFL